MNLKESDTIELKKSTAELKQALVVLCAFANSGEGIIYFGVTDSGEVCGQQVSDRTLKKVASTVLSSIEPRIYPNIYIENIRRGNVSVNAGIAEILFLAGYVERWGTGINRMSSLMQNAGLNFTEIEEVSGNLLVTFEKKRGEITEQVAEQVKRLLMVFSKKASSGKELMDKLELSHRPTFLYSYLKPALESDLIEMTEKPRSPKQKYVLTEKGKTVLNKLGKK